MEDYGESLLLDGITVFSCIGLLLRFGDLRLSHPATAYIVFHLHTVTSRLAGLLGGAMALYENAPGFFEAIRPAEIVRAALYGDMAFWAVTIAWIVVKATPRREVLPSDNVMILDPRILRPILLVTFLIGLIGTRYAAVIPGVPLYDFDQSNPWSATSYLLILPSWVGLAVLGYIYLYGFNWISTGVLAGYLGLMAIQGGARFRVIIGLILAVNIWVEHRHVRWPSKWLTLGLLAAGMAFFPMKSVGALVQQGESSREVSRAVSDTFSDVADGAAGDQMFLDEFAAALTLLDLQDKRYMGSIYLPLLTLPIPRALWPEKPSLAGFLNDISTTSRPMAVSGMITTYLGEAYANFGLPGIFIVPPLLAIALILFMRKAYEYPANSVLRFSYVLLSVNLIQVYRDGLTSIVVFTFVNMMPLGVVVLAHFVNAFFNGRKHVQITAPVATWPDPPAPPVAANDSLN